MLNKVRRNSRPLLLRPQRCRRINPRGARRREPRRDERRHEEHDRHGHFIGFAFDVVLVLRLAQETMQRDIEQDLVESYRPVLNELLRGYQGNGAS